MPLEVLEGRERPEAGRYSRRFMEAVLEVQLAPPCPIQRGFALADLVDIYRDELSQEETTLPESNDSIGDTMQNGLVKEDERRPLTQKEIATIKSKGSISATERALGWRKDMLHGYLRGRPYPTVDQIEALLGLTKEEIEKHQKKPGAKKGFPPKPAKKNTRASQKKTANTGPRLKVTYQNQATPENRPARRKALLEEIRAEIAHQEKVLASLRFVEALLSGQEVSS